MTFLWASDATMPPRDTSMCFVEVVVPPPRRSPVRGLRDTPHLCAMLNMCETPHVQCLNIAFTIDDLGELPTDGSVDGELLRPSR